MTVRKNVLGQSSADAALRRLPVVGVRVETRHLQGARLRLVGHLVDHQPVLVVSDHTHLEMRQHRVFHLQTELGSA